jgi:hypothetical protein
VGLITRRTLQRPAQENEEDNHHGIETRFKLGRITVRHQFAIGGMAWVVGDPCL